MNVLILEDEVLPAVMLADEVRLAGHTVLGPAYSIAEAMKLADAAPPDLALLNAALSGDERSADAVSMLKERWNTACLFLSEDGKAPAVCYTHAIGFLERPFGGEQMQEALRVVEQIIAGEPVVSVPEGLTFYVDPVDQPIQ